MYTYTIGIDWSRSVLSPLASCYNVRTRVHYKYWGQVRNDFAMHTAKLRWSRTIGEQWNVVEGI